MSAVLLSNWFPIRAYDSADPRLSYTRVYSSTRELALLEACSFFCFPPLSLFFSFSYFFFFFQFCDSVHRVGRLSGWSIPPPRSASLVRNHSRWKGERKRGTERYIVESRLSPRIFWFDDLEPPSLRDLSEPTWDWISSSRIRVNDRR